MATDTAERFNCGEIFITNNFGMILECKSCEGKFGVYPEFLDHLFEIHVDDWIANSKNTTKESSITQASEDTPVILFGALDGAADATERFHCGEMFITNNFCMIIECKSCDGKFGVYPEFLDHIFEKHFDDWTANSKNPTKESSKTQSDDLTDNHQYVDSSTLYEVSYEFEGEEFTEVLESMDDDAVDDIIEEESQPTPAIIVVNKNVRTVRGKQTTRSDNDRERKYKCKICGLAFADTFNLRGHEQRHSTIKPFTCLKCEKAFYTRTELKTHIRRHNGERPFVCPYCGKGFVTAGTLTMHEKRHTGNRVHKCDQCDKSFYDTRQLKNHFAVHTKERNYSCEECHAKFTRQTTLRTHMKLHENALRYECIICQKRFNQRPTLLWHIKSKHKVMNKESDSKDSA